MTPNDRPLISVVIPNFNGAAFLGPCLSSLNRQAFTDFEVLVVDNASSDASVEAARRAAPAASILGQTKNLGFAGAANAGIRTAAGEWVAILNNDTEASEQWLAECAAAIGRHPDAAFLACKIFDFRRRDLLYSAGDCFLRAGIGYRRGQEKPDRPEYNVEAEAFAACGCAAIYRRSVLELIGGYDDRFFAYLEDVELGLRLQALGLHGYYAPGACVYHHGGATGGGEFSPLAVFLRTRNALLLLAKSIPARILLRCLPMIVLAQLFWLARVIRRGRFLDYLRGLAGTIPLMPAMLRARRELRTRWSRARVEALWRAILRSEAAARTDCVPARSKCPSAFLRIYFRLFSPGGPEGQPSRPGSR